MEKAMVIDDSRAIRRILGKDLQSLGFEVSEASNGVEALDRLKEQDGEIRLFMVDWNMPEMNGLELVTELRSDQRYGEASIVMVTTETALDQMVAALEAGANEYIMKPFTKEVIEDKLRLLGILD